MGEQRPRASSAEALARMKRQRRQDTGPERALRRELARLGLRYRLHLRVVPGVRRAADVVFPRARVAVFVDGCFWHGCADHGTWPKANSVWWRQKIESNRRRDADTDRRLAEAGWRVVRVWEHEPPAEAAARIAGLVRAAAPVPASVRVPRRATAGRVAPDLRRRG